MVGRSLLRRPLIMGCAATPPDNSIWVGSKAAALPIINLVQSRSSAEMLEATSPS
jgi:hypothetical protein